MRFNGEMLGNRYARRILIFECATVGRQLYRALSS